MHIIRYQRYIFFFLLSRNHGGISWSYETNDLCTTLGNGEGQWRKTYKVSERHAMEGIERVGKW